MDYVLHNDTFWTKATIDAQHVMAMLHTVLPNDLSLPAGHNKTICWRSKFTLRRQEVNGHSVYKGHLHDQSFYIDFDKDDSLADPRRYYIQMLTNKTGIAKGLHTSVLCIPRVYLAGFPKSGSTALDDIITVHPQIHHGLSKEPRWWVPPQRNPNSHHFRPKLTYFIKYLLQYQYKDMKAIPQQDLLLIDSSPNLLPKWSNIGYGEEYEGICTLPAIMSTMIPNPQFVVILRDPIEYLYSNFWFRCSSKVYKSYRLTRDQIRRGPIAFHAMIMKRLKRFRTCLQQYSVVERCALEQSLFNDQNDDYFPCGQAPLGAAVYYVHIIKWLSLFPRESFFFVTSEKFFQSPFAVANKVWNFLGVSRLPDVNHTALIERLKRGENNQIQFDYRRDPELQMLPRTRVILKKFFRPFNNKLSSVLSSSGYVWRHEWQGRKV